MKEIYRVRDLRFSYGKNEVLKGANLSVKQGDFLAFIGANGSGKSTLIKLLLGIEKPTSGTIEYDGKPLGKDTDFSRISYVPQLMVASYDFPITVKELVDLGLYGEKLTADERERRIDDALSLVDLEGFRDRLYGALSGGQRQRVLIAKALISMTDVLILDEPTTGIDFKAREELFHIFRHLHDIHGITILMITHELHLVEDMIDGVYVLEDGVLEKEARLMELFQYEYMIRAMIVGLVLSVVIPAMGVVIVNRRLAMIGDALSHVSLAGVMFGLLVGINPILGAIITCAVAALSMEWIRRRFPLTGKSPRR